MRFLSKIFGTKKSSIKSNGVKINKPIVLDYGKIACIQCGAKILPNVADKNIGLCSSCFIRFEKMNMKQVIAIKGSHKIEKKAILDYPAQPDLALLFCKDCSKSYLIAADSFIAPFNELFNEFKEIKDVYFVAPVVNISNKDKLLCINNISAVREKIREGIKVHWVCSGCSDIKKKNEFPRYFGEIQSLNKSIMYYLMEEKELAFVIMKKSFIESNVQKSGKPNVEEIDVVLTGMLAMERILGFESSQTVDEILNLDTSRVIKYYNKGYEVDERQSCTELLQEKIPEWDVPIWVMTFRK